MPQHEKQMFAHQITRIVVAAIVFAATPVLTADVAPECKIPNTYDSYVLALSWQAGFCEHNRNARSKPECEALNTGKTHITNMINSWLVAE